MSYLTTLEAAIMNDRENPDHYLEYADWLLAEGDPRGRLIQLDYQSLINGETHPDRNKLFSAHKHYFLGDMAESEVDWFLGFIRRATIWHEDSANCLLAHPSAKFLHTLEVMNGYFDYQPAIRAIVAHGSIENVRVLHVGGKEMPNDEDSTHIQCDLSAIWPIFPNLEKICIRVERSTYDRIIDEGFILGQIAAPALTTFQLSSNTLTEANRTAIYQADWPNLQTLIVQADATLFAENADWDNIRRLSHLTELGLSGNQYKVVPPGIPTLTGLTKLDLSDNDLEDIAPITALTALGSLDISKNDGLGRHLVDLSALKALTVFKATDCKLKDIRTVCALTTLESLILDNNFISHLPDDIQHLNRLTTLSLYHNRLERAEGMVALVTLTQLRYLCLTRNYCAALPDNLGQLKHLETLLLSDNKLTTLPASAVKLAKLRTLNVVRNTLTVLPEGFGQLGHLEKLDISHNHLAKLPEGFGRLDHLQKLDMSHNALLILPEDFCQLRQLSELKASHNRLQALPDGFEQLTHLENLYLTRNRLAAFPLSVCDIKSLRWLSISDNDIDTLPRQIGQLVNLVELTVEGNNLSALPNELIRLNKLESFSTGFGKLKQSVKVTRFLTVIARRKFK